MFPVYFFGRKKKQQRWSTGVGRPVPSILNVINGIEPFGTAGGSQTQVTNKETIAVRMVFLRPRV